MLRQVNRSGKSRVVIVDSEDRPRLVLSANDFLREAMFSPEWFNPLQHCHRPIIVSSGEQKLGELIPRFRLYSGREGDDIIEDDVVLT